VSRCGRRREPVGLVIGRKMAPRGMPSRRCASSTVWRARIGASGKRAGNARMGLRARWTVCAARGERVETRDPRGWDPPQAARTRAKLVAHCPIAFFFFWLHRPARKTRSDDRRKRFSSGSDSE